MFNNKVQSYWDFRSGCIADLIGSNDGTFVSTPTFSREGLHLDGVDDAVDIGDTSLTIKSVIVLLEPNTTTEDVADFDAGTHTLEFSTGTLTATGFSSSTLYVNGVAGSTVTTATTMVGATTATGFAADNFDIGKETIFFDGTIKAVLLSTSELTATEMAQFTAEVDAIKYPSKIYGGSLANVGVDGNNSVCSLNMKVSGATITDDSGNGNDGTTMAGVTTEKTIIGDAIVLDGSSSFLTVADAASLSFGNGSADSAMSITAWVNCSDFDKASIVEKGNGTDGFEYAFGFNASDYLNFTAVNNGQTDITPTDRIQRVSDVGFAGHENKWLFVGCSYDGGGANTGITLYSNNGIKASTVGGAGSYTAMNGTAADVLSGKRFMYSTQYFPGKIAGLKIWDKEITEAEFQSEYYKGLPATEFQTGWGAIQSNATESAGQLSNTPFIINSGTWKISTDTIDGQLCKAIECVTAGVLYTPTDAFNTSAEAAYGSWEFWVYKGGDANVWGMLPIADTIGSYGAVGQDGYMFQIHSNESIIFYETVNGSESVKVNTAADVISINAWYKINITRSNQGSFTIYLDDTPITAVGGTPGTNPFTDTTATVSNYICLDFDAGDKIAFSDLIGNRSFTKKSLI